MLFNSYEFIFVYLPITLLGYYLTAKFIKNEAAKNIFNLCIGLFLFLLGY